MLEPAVEELPHRHPGLPVLPSANLEQEPGLELPGLLRRATLGGQGRHRARAQRSRPVVGSTPA
ncbi:MAG: hypothetical protein R6X23_15395 [Acidimicrobiia bacterium]